MIAVVLAAAVAMPGADSLAASWAAVKGATDGAARTAVLADAAKLRWPLVPEEIDRAIAESLETLDPAARRAWAMDRALPVLAGELAVDRALVPKILAEVRTEAASADMALLQKARTEYAARALAEAEANYRAVTRTSPLWPDALRERAWTLLLLERPMDAMGSTVSLEAPYFPPEDNAEARLVRATVLLQRCRFVEARETVRQLADATVETPDEQQAIALVKAGTAPKDGVWTVAWGAPLVKRVIGALPEAGARRGELEVRAAKLLAKAATDEAEARRELKVRALAIRYEALKAERRLLESGKKPKKPEPANVPKLDDDEVAWSFDGTFWRDELGTYRTVPADACPGEQRR